MRQAIERLQRRPNDRQRPNQTEQRPTPRATQRAEREWRVAARDKYVDRAVIDFQKDALGAAGRNGTDTTAASNATPWLTLLAISSPRLCGRSIIVHCPMPLINYVGAAITLLRPACLAA